MRALDTSSTNDWLYSNGYALNANGVLDLTQAGTRLLYEISHRASVQWSMALALSELFRDQRVCMFVYEWTSDELPQHRVFRSLMVSQEDQRHVHDRPGHVFETGVNGDRAALLELIAFMLAFNWQGFLIPAPKGTLVWLADEILEIRADVGKGEMLKSHMANHGWFQDPYEEISE